MSELAEARILGTTAAQRQHRRRMVRRLAASQGGVVARRQLYRLGITRAEVVAEIRSGRWAKSGRQTIAVGTQDVRGRWWRAIFEVGPSAALDGRTALAAAGLRDFGDDTAVHVSVPKSARYRRSSGLVIHETRRRTPGDLAIGGIPRTRPAVASVRAALWAKSGREAAVLLAMGVQQRIVDPALLWEAVATVRRAPRRALIRAVCADVTSGAESMGELDFARACRRYGLPEPDRQSVRIVSSGQAFLDAEWKQYGAVVEIDGVQHQLPANVIDDMLRQNDVTLQDGRVLRIPVLGLRVNEAQFMSQVRRLLIDGGWHDPAA